jgi:hypothetical protein
LLNGLDDIGLTLQHDEIAEFEQIGLGNLPTTPAGPGSD